MRATSAGIMLVLAALAATACGPRQVEVRTAPEENRVSQIVLHVTNNLADEVNVYVVTGGTDMFIRQVPSHTTMDLPVQNVAPGTIVTLKATTIEGTRTFTRRDVTLSGRYNWTLP